MQGMNSPRDPYGSSSGQNLINQFDDRISNFDDGRSGISANTKLGINNQSSKKMGMNSRNNMYDLRPDEIRTEKMNSK